MKRRSVLLAAAVLASCGPVTPRETPPTPVVEPSPQALRNAAVAFERFRVGFLEWYHEAHPVRSSELGLREYDGAYPAVDRRSIQARIDALLDWDAELRRIPIRLMRDEDRADYALAEFAIRAELLELEEVRSWATDPVEYVRLVARGLGSVAERRDVPAAERTDALRGRIAGAEAVLSAGRENVGSAPRTWTELALEETAGLIAYVERDLPALLGGAGAGLGPSLEGLVASLRSHAGWLESELLPAPRAEFRLGRYLFSRTLLYQGHTDVSVQELQRVNEQRVAQLRAEAERLAGEVDPRRTARAILDSIARESPPPESLLRAARDMVREARDWTASSGVVTLPEPAEALPEARALPPYDGLAVTALRSAGPFGDPRAVPAFEIRVTEPALDALSLPDLLGATLRRTYPGEYLLRLRQQGLPTDVRRTFTARTFAEGWGPYAEEMAFEQGFRPDDDAARLAHLRRALHDQALWDAAVRLHVAGDETDRVVERFMEVAHVAEDVARREILRVSRDPLAFAGALGGLQIRELREAYQRYLEERDEVFSLQAFHDRLLELALPANLASEVLMPPPPEQGVQRRRPTRRIPL